MENVLCRQTTKLERNASAREGEQLMSLQERFRDLEKKKSDHQAAECRDSQERNERCHMAEAILWPVVEEVCHEFAAALGFRIQQEVYSSEPWYRRPHKRPGCYYIGFSGRRGTWYTIHVRADTFAIIAIDVTVTAAYEESSGGPEEIYPLASHISEIHFGEPPEACRVREALATALEKAAKPYVEDTF